MPDAALDILDAVTGLALEPVPIERLGDHPELDEEVSREIFGLDFTALFTPEPDECHFIGPHDHSGIRTANKGLTVLAQPFLRL